MTDTMQDFIPRADRYLQHKADGRRPGRFSAGISTCFTRFLVLHLALFLLMPPALPAQTHLTGDSLRLPTSGAFLLKERSSGNILLSKDADRVVSPASLTKIMTCLLAIERGRLDDDVLITSEATSVEPSKAGFRPREKIRLIDLVKASMVNSSNDAAFAIAIHLSGSVDAFVSDMNTKARSIGMNRTRFTNPAGFDKGVYAGNLSTAADLMRLTEVAIRNPVFNSIARLEQAVFLEQTTRKIYSLRTHNKLLDRYPHAVGIKTGFTNRAGKCLIGRAVKDDRDLLLVMLNADTDRWTLAANLFDRAFAARKPDSFRFMEAFGDDVGNARPASGAMQPDRVEQAFAMLQTGQDDGKPPVSKPVLKSKKRSRSASKTAREGLKKGSGRSSKAALKSRVGRSGKTSKTVLKSSRKGTKKVTKTGSRKSKKSPKPALKPKKKTAAVKAKASSRKKTPAALKLKGKAKKKRTATSR
jgi:D-alanyl-D-alanine carboxypeptidase (penicillin-binding protein 5/6)